MTPKNSIKIYNLETVMQTYGQLESREQAARSLHWCCSSCSRLPGVDGVRGVRHKPSQRHVLGERGQHRTLLKLSSQTFSAFDYLSKKFCQSQMRVRNWTVQLVNFNLGGTMKTRGEEIWTKSFTKAWNMLTRTVPSSDVVRGRKI